MKKVTSLEEDKDELFKDLQKPKVKQESYKIQIRDTIYWLLRRVKELEDLVDGELSKRYRICKGIEFIKCAARVPIGECVYNINWKRVNPNIDDFCARLKAAEGELSIPDNVIEDIDILKK